MKTHPHGVLLAILLIWLGSSAFAQSSDPQRDTQIWPDATITFKLKNNFSLFLFGTIRLGRDDSALISQQAGIGLTRGFGKHFSASFSYRYVANEPTPGKSSTEHRVFADFTPRTPLKFGVNVSDRNRIEWRNINETISWRYRNRLQFDRPFSFPVHGHERKITPYVSAESMYDTRYRAWNRTQMYMGARLPISKHVTFDGFYMKQWDARARPGFLNVFGAFWKLDF
ncbi:MAG: DUF2490 domain-containing protein [Acidobacteriota bacterium]|nr:DUF2490 domain-containing protein [Acidobacteriota bacterium]